jgi:Pyruvate/2-oxoacid:ferredoxin oxidoreductase gamma subunit
MVGLAALLSRLQAAQRDDYPITIKSGHSISELVLSPDEINYTGISRPDALLILTADGYGKVAHYLPLSTNSDRVFVTPAFADLKTQAQVKVIDPRRSPLRVPRASTTLAVLTAVVKQLNLFPFQALEEAAGMGRKQFVDDNLKAIAAGLTLAET